MCLPKESSLLLLSLPPPLLYAQGGSPPAFSLLAGAEFWGGLCLVDAGGGVEMPLCPFLL